MNLNLAKVVCVVALCTLTGCYYREYISPVPAMVSNRADANSATARMLAIVDQFARENGYRRYKENGAATVNKRVAILRYYDKQYAFFLQRKEVIILVTTEQSGNVPQIEIRGQGTSYDGIGKAKREITRRLRDEIKDIQFDVKETSEPG